MTYHITTDRNVAAMLTKVLYDILVHDIVATTAGVRYYTRGRRNGIEGGFSLFEIMIGYLDKISSFVKSRALIGGKISVRSIISTSPLTY